MKAAPLVSVIIPTYKRADFAREAVESVRRQTYSNWEALIVDDGTPEPELTSLRGLCSVDPRLRFLPRDREPKGAAVCRNIGIESAHGEYVLFLDSDDILSPGCLEGRVGVMRDNPRALFAVFPSLLFKEKLDDLMLLWNTSPANQDDLCRFLAGDSVWPISGPLWRSDALKERRFDEALVCWQDVDFHIGALLSRPEYVKRLDGRPDHYIRRHSGESISQRGLATPPKLTSMFRVFKKSCEELDRSSAPEREWKALSFTMDRIVRMSLKINHPDVMREALGLVQAHRWPKAQRYAMSLGLWLQKWNSRQGQRLLRRILVPARNTNIGDVRYVPEGKF